MMILTILGALFFGGAVGTVLAAILAQSKVTDMEIENERLLFQGYQYRDALRMIEKRCPHETTKQYAAMVLREVEGDA